MSILSSIYTGVSGLNSNGQQLSVIGDNIANVNTVGFKGSRMAFGDILSQSLTGLSGTSQVGRGVAVEGVTPMFTQGSFQNTSSGLDVAIDGEGFFMVNNNGATNYTRAGNFQLDQNGNVVTPSGAILQGYLANAAGVITGQIGNVQLVGTPVQAFATTTATLSANVDASAAPAAAWTFVTGATPPAAAQYNNSTSITVYDTLGAAHQVNVYFAKGTPVAGPPPTYPWTAHYIYQDPTTNAYSEIGTQNMVFDANGALLSGAAGTATLPGGNAISVDLTGTTQFASAFSVSAIGQNGYASGTLKNVLIGDDGTVTGVYTNGQTRSIAQLCLARFTAPTELTKLGNNLFAQSSASGQPIVGAPDTSGLGRTLSNTLELSNVDIAEEFTNLISAQRGFQANTKIITTTDELLNLLISIKQ
jgi:flagellar hook protein FlgE